MLLRIDNAGVPMKLVFQLAKKLRKDPDYVESVQQLTLDTSRPGVGLKGTYGLFATEEWWESIRNGRMPLRYISGVIRDVYAAGQDYEESGVINSINVEASDGTLHYESILTDLEEDRSLFRLGHRVDVVYALDDLKDPAVSFDSSGRLPFALEMAVSTEPVELPNSLDDRR